MNTKTFGVLAIAFALLGTSRVQSESPRIRVATYNVSLFGDSAGEMSERLADGRDPQAERIARVIQTVRPDVLLVNELDYDGNPGNASLLANLLATGEHGIRFQHVYAAASNTGLPSGLDLDNNGTTDDAADAYGYGKFQGQYAFAILSRYPIDENEIRTFQDFAWSRLPGASVPVMPDGKPFYKDSTWSMLRLSSKNHVDVPITIVSDDGQPYQLHILASHPTPPVFDGPEDRNGIRNRDEIRFWKYYLDNDQRIADDSGASGGLPTSESFVIVGDLNSDPIHGDSIHDGIASLIDHPRTQDANPMHDGQTTTALFGARQIRVDYALPSSDLQVTASGVYWPIEGSGADDILATDHRLVWIDIHWKPDSH